MSVGASVQNKQCTKCGEVKLLSDFYSVKANKNKYRSHCKVCTKESRAKYCAANREKIKERVATYQKNNPEIFRASAAKYRAANPEKCKAMVAKHRAANLENYKETLAKWSRENPDKRRASFTKYRAIKLKAIPTWLTEDDYKAMDAIYAEANRLEAVTGIKYHVDHIHPLQGKYICGLHCPSNLQILTESENCIKSNKFTPYVESEVSQETHKVVTMSRK